MVTIIKSSVCTFFGMILIACMSSCSHSVCATYAQEKISKTDIVTVDEDLSLIHI